MVTMNALCVRCQIDKHTPVAHGMDPEKASCFFKDFLPLLNDAIGCANSCRLDSDLKKLYRKHFGNSGIDYSEDKRISNEFVLPRLSQIRELVEKQKDPVFAGLQFAILGNYLDFSALKGRVSFEKFEELLTNGLSMELPEDTYKT